jgi:N-acetylmuramoyl-L-alanine amidase
MGSPQEFTRTSVLRQVFTILGWGILAATIFMALVPGGAFARALSRTLSGDAGGFVPASPGDLPTPTARPRPRIGIVAGHWGNDSGAVCADELTELQVNLTVASLVKSQLHEEGYDVDLLKEFDPLLFGYRALALVSIHADSCDYINDQATGYKVAAALGTTNPSRAERLSNCIRSRYEARTGLSYHAGSITPDMTSYHAFDEIHHDTPAVIIEIGFLNLDRQILTGYPDIIARGITDGVLCFVYNEDAILPSPTAP